MALIDKLKAIADAIRAKTGSSEGLTLDEMVTEIEGIETGNHDMEDALVDRTITAYRNDRVTSIGANTFSGCSDLASVDFTSVASIGTSVFGYCSSLTSVILRNAEAVCALANAYVFQSSAIESGTGYIYVPADLVDSYKADAKWSTYADQIRALEDYTVDGTITGELDETKI